MTFLFLFLVVLFSFLYVYLLGCILVYCFYWLACLSHFVGDVLGGFTKTPPSFASVSNQNAISFLSTTVTCLVWFSGFYFVYISILVPLFPCMLLFPFFFACNKALSSLDLHVWCPLSYLLWSRPLGCECERYPDFRVKEEEFRLRFV